MSNTYRLHETLLHPRHQPILSLAFDPTSDVLWSGTAGGSVTAHYPTHARGVTYPATTKGHPVTKVVCTDKEVRAVTESGMGSWGKGGVNKWYYTPTKPLSTFSDHPSTSNYVVLGTATAAQPEFIVINATNGTEVRTMSSPAYVTHLKTSYNYLVSGASDGIIRTHDFRTSSKKSSDPGASGGTSVIAHPGGIQDLEVSGNYIYTCGWGHGQFRPMPDALVKVFDVRTMKPLSPIPFVQPPTLINAHPKRSTSIVVTSAQGMVSIVDVTNPMSAHEYHQLSVSSYISSVAFSPTGVYLAFGDADGYIQMLYSGPEEERIPWNGFEGDPPPWPDPPEALPLVEWTDSTPLNMIGMPYYDEALLSGTSAALFNPGTYFPPRQKIPEAVLKGMRVHDSIGYAPLPRELRGTRNLAPKEPVLKDEGRFRSNQHRRGKERPSAQASNYPKPEIPVHWRKTDIKYSKFGIEDFDFGYYNKTEYSGLETHIMNSYTNAIVQSLFYILPLRAHAKSHITTSCDIEHCLLCELGFLARMLEDAKGTNCQASNFCKVIGRKPQATALSLIDYALDGVNPDYLTMIQQFNRFVMEEMASEGSTNPNPVIVPQELKASDQGSPTPPPVTQIFGMSSKTVATCGQCRAAMERSHSFHVVDLNYPRKQLPHEPPVSLPHSISQLLTTSIQRETSYRSTCQNCRQQATFVSSRAIPSGSLPPVLSKHNVLEAGELPTPGTVVAIDAEFVALQQEESEYRSDGTKKIIRPSLMTLARVSVLRGQGTNSGTPFMDDYIHTTDTIVNYLTEFSGIRFGDLDPTMSRHTLLPLKTVYKKLRLLVDLGCIFVGHGLPKDFRTINLFVPPEQVLDTVDLYFIKERQRRLSLRFLSWYVLKEPIQGVTHDSIEDARAALLLYQKYQEHESEGTFDDLLEEIYREGKKTVSVLLLVPTYSSE
ncbi:hypothetical protein M407DRAFT_78054 [Tulasnella calospora MUT 4182]|uniref:USP domain-containing protein n=1 Tax=Tulasnella calospora MUT 4182 TaxID=1051891 RepID=A0A0C3QEH9_9AGAM|nr:hypothetical protein M407DRAFT_78054 [Tulasnella calospora MUT 4182]